MEQAEEGRSRTQKNKPKHRKVRRGIRIALVVVLLLALSLAAMAGLSIKPPAVSNVFLNDNQEEQTEEREEGVYNILVVGCDKVGLNTDTILVMSLDSINNRANVMSIPRDTMSNVTRKVKKINSAYAIGAKNGKGNIENLKKEVSYLMGFEVDNYVVVNLGAFEEIIDAIGGVTIDVPRNMNYDDPYQDLHIHISKGLQTLNGQQAIGFVRYRSGYAEGDLGRVKAQQLFIQTLAKQLASPSTLPKVPKLADIILRNMDTDLTNGEIVWYAKEALQLDMETSLNMFVLPGSAAMVNGLSYYLPDEQELLPIINEYFNPYATAITSLNIVNVGNVRQQETVRKNSLTVEQRRQEEVLEQQLQQEEILQEELEQQNPTELPGQTGEPAVPDQPQQGTQTTPVAPEQQTPAQPVTPEQPPVAEQPPAEVPSQPAESGSGYNTIPGEVLKQDAQ